MLPRLQRLYAAPVQAALRRRSAPVSLRRLVSPSFHALCGRLTSRLDWRGPEGSGEVGFSAPQLGENYRVIAVKLSSDGHRRIRIVDDNLSEETRSAARQSQVLTNNAEAAGAQENNQNQSNQYNGPIPGVRTEFPDLPDPPMSEEYLSSQMNSYPSVGEATIFINPEIIAKSKATFAEWEDCLSVPEAAGRVERPFSINVNFLNRIGQSCSARLHGTDARVFQHELDHLEGILFIDHIKRENDILAKEEKK